MKTPSKNARRVEEGSSGGRRAGDDEFTGTKEVEERHRIDEASLDRWMREHVEGYPGR